MASIKILKGDPATEKLTLNDGGFSWVSKKETIVWKIVHGSGVQSISNIQVKASPPSNVKFSKLPHREGSSDNWSATIDARSAPLSMFYYSIFWIPDPGTDPNPSKPIKEYDPIIAVRPTPFNLRFIILLLLGLFGVSALTLYLNKKAAKHH